jgi:hypothetical protein
MSATKAPEAPAPSKKASLLDSALTQAAEVTPRKEAGDIIAGPFPVGNVGSTEVRAIQRGSETYHVGVFHPAGGGKSQRFPLAAIAALAEGLGA